MPHTAICFLPATDLVRLVRAKELSSREVLEAHLDRIEQVNKMVNAIVTMVPEQALERAAAAGRGTSSWRRRRSAARNSYSPQGLDAYQGHPYHVRLADFQGLRAGGGCPHRSTVKERWCHHGREDEHARIRCWIANLQRAVWRDSQSIRHYQDLRRQQRWRGGRARLRYGAARGRLRHGGLSPKPGEFLQCGRSPTLAGEGTHLACPGRMGNIVGTGSDGPHGARRRAHAQRHRGLRSAIADLDQRAWQSILALARARLPAAYTLRGAAT